MSIARALRVAALAAFALTGAAQAAAPAATFDLTTASGTLSSVLFTQGSLTLTVTPSGDANQIKAGTFGLGANGVVGDVEYLNGGEALLLSFSQAVTLTGVTLFDAPEKKTADISNTFSLAIGSGTPVTFGAPATVNFGTGTITGLSFTGKVFKLTATDSLQLRGLTVTPVPEADAALMALAGLGIVGLRTLRRRRG